MPAQWEQGGDKMVWKITEVPIHKAVEPGCGLCLALLAYWMAPGKTGMLAVGILFEEKEKLGMLALMTKLPRHNIYTGKKKTRDRSWYRKLGFIISPEYFWMGRELFSRKINSASSENTATPYRGMGDTFWKCGLEIAFRFFLFHKFFSIHSKSPIVINISLPPPS